MSKIVIFPDCKTSTVDGVLREDGNYSVDVFSCLEDVHCLTIDEEAGKGEVCFIQIPNVAKPNLEITDFTPYQDVINYAKNLCDASLNPCVFYATHDGALVGEDVYSKAEPFYCCKFPRRASAPTGFTSVAPEGELNTWQEWFWSGEAWVASPFPLTYVLSEGQAHMKKLLKTHYNELMNNQLREYNMWELSQDPNLENFTPADAEVHGHQTMLSYDNHLRSQADSLTQTIDSATDVSQLYNIDLTLQS
jgi:hypothetical protein